MNTTLLLRRLCYGIVILALGMAAVPCALAAQDQQKYPPKAPTSDKDWRTLQNELKFGREYAAQFEQRTKLLTDPAVIGYVERIGQQLALECNSGFRFTFKVIDSSSADAVAFPGGPIYISSGLMEMADDEAGLAAAIVHQIAHVCAHHFILGLTQQQYEELKQRPLIHLKGPIGIGHLDLVPLPLPPLTQNFPPEYELEADALGLKYLYSAGYDPGAFTGFYSGLESAGKRNSSLIAEGFLTHLQTPERRHETLRRVAALKHRAQYVINTSEFDAIKARLTAIQASRGPLPRARQR